MQPSPRGGRDERLRELRRAAGSRDGGSRAVDQTHSSVRPAVEVDRDARAAAEKLRETLKVQPPWSREVEAHRQRCRNLFLTLLFGHPLSTHAQSLEPLWANTTYSLISSYRAITSAHEAALPPNNGPGSGRRKPTAAHNELKKVLTRFRQVLSSEDTFYRDLISRLVGFYQLQPLAREYLSAVSIGCPNVIENGNGGVEHGLAPPMSADERREKLGLVYKALICLGDLERYKEQYDERARREAREGRPAAQLQEKYGKAWTYYEVARALVPDDGSAFNQLAVISTYVGDDFCCVYYYFRAMAVRIAFKNIGQILDKFLGKLYERWAARIVRRRQGLPGQDGEEQDSEEMLDATGEMKRDLLVLAAILYRRQGLSSVPKLQSQFLETLGEQLVNRQLPSETIVKITAIVIGTHWQARQSASLGAAVDPRLVQRRQQAEALALQLLLGTYTQLLAVSAAEVEEALRAQANGSAVDITDAEPQLHLHISAVVRRILPALRIFSKWLKLHLQHLSRIQSTASAPYVAEFWSSYTRLIVALATLFPIDQLPLLVEPLEEDIDMRGFTPLAWGMIKGSREEQHDFHPNEEQLMRIADLQVDAKLLAQTASGANALSPQVRHPALPGLRSYPGPEKQDDLASVSTETEDDPVNLAMRATLAPSSVGDEELAARAMEDEEDEEEEIIVWGGRSGSARHTPQQDHQHRPSFPHLVSQGTPTAQDLLQTLVIDSKSPPLRQSFSNPAVPRHTPPAAAPPAQGSPRILFGGDVNGASIWTMTREESGRGVSRASLAHIWNDQNAAPPAHPSGLPGLPGLPSHGHLAPSASTSIAHPPPHAAPAQAGPAGWQGNPRGGSTGEWAPGVWSNGYGGAAAGQAAAYGAPGTGVYAQASAGGAGGPNWSSAQWNGRPQGYPR